MEHEMDTGSWPYGLIMENQMEKTMENDMGTLIYGVGIRTYDVLRVPWQQHDRPCS